MRSSSELYHTNQHHLSWFVFCSACTARLENITALTCIVQCDRVSWNVWSVWQNRSRIFYMLGVNTQGWLVGNVWFFAMIFVVRCKLVSVSIEEYWKELCSVLYGVFTVVLWNGQYSWSPMSWSPIMNRIVQCICRSWNTHTDLLYHAFATSQQSWHEFYKKS